MNSVVIKRGRTRGGRSRVSGIRVMSYKGGDDVNLGKIFGMIFTVFIIPLLLLSFIVGGYKGYRYLLRSPYFEISEVRVEGNNILKYKEILRLVGNIIHQNMFRVDISTVSSRLKGSHWIKDVVVEKDLPRSIVIKIDERVPFALISFSGGTDTYLIDDNGIMFKKVEEGIDGVIGGDYSSLPIITVTGVEPPSLGGRISSEELSVGLNVLRHIEESRFLKEVGIERIYITSGKGVTLFTKGKDKDNLISGGIEIRIAVYHDSIDKGEIEKRFSSLDTILDILNRENRENREVRYIDLAFKDKVVVN